ncbi:carbon starvation protein A [bacterium]|nr:carbon starvation protein A [bacterium]
MNIGLAMLASVAGLALAYLFYGRRIAKILGVNKNNATPAVRNQDGVDFVPTRPAVLLGHHFASIAAAGPIVGPTLALLYGFLPTWLWILIGVTFIGAVHDFSALFVSVREEGRSIAEIAKKTLGKTGFLFFILFAILLCILVCAAFLQLTAVSLTSLYPLKEFGLPEDQSILKTVVEGGVLKGVIGGIASTSVIVMTVVAPVIGYLLYKKNANLIAISLLAFFVCIVSVYIGFVWPVTLDTKIWMAIICAYCFIAGWIPVWIVLQPRDFTNVQLLYFGIIVMVVGIVACGFAGVVIDAPAFNFSTESLTAMGNVWPFLFVTIACGSVSGAHALIATGTTSKQLGNEKHAPMIGYGGMLLEALLGICVTLIILGGLGYAEYHDIVWPHDELGHIKSGNAPLAFAVGVGHTLQKGLHIPSVYGTVFGILLLEGFLVTTIDTIVRLTRYLFEELWLTLFTTPPAIMRNKFFNTIIPVAGMAALGFTNAYTSIWPIFGSANQLLAALTLTAISAWLIQKSKPYWFAAIPALFMCATTLTSLVILVNRYIEKNNWALTITDSILIILTVGVLVMTFRYFYNLRKEMAGKAES